MEQAIRNEYNVTRNRAKFLSRQETSLLVSKYREENYREAGIVYYRWSTSNDQRVRHDHRELNGNIFRFDEPPVVDQKSGRRGNPGEDFSCRCIAIPLLSYQIKRGQDV
jgi:SPP1 gp7 family putative phage head morphogenesis protein